MLRRGEDGTYECGEEGSMGRLSLKKKGEDDTHKSGEEKKMGHLSVKKRGIWYI